MAAEQLRLMTVDNRLIIDSLKVVCCSRVRKGKTSILWHKTMRIQDVLTNLGIYLVICSRKRKCWVIISKGKSRAPAVLTRILWHKAKRIYCLIACSNYLAILWTSQVKRLIVINFCCRASTINRLLSCQRFCALILTHIKIKDKDK